MHDLNSVYKETREPSNRKPSKPSNPKSLKLVLINIFPTINIAFDLCRTLKHLTLKSVSNRECIPENYSPMANKDTS